jgi:hypothetical protein
MSAGVNLLLLFSALLSALSGIGASVRGPVAAQAARAQQPVAAAPRVAPAPTMRPSLALPRPTTTLEGSRLSAPPVARIPLWASRRRE